MNQVLVVDDEPQICGLVGRALDRVGIRCDTAGDGHQAMQCFESRQHHAVVTDLRMPRGHGHSLAVHLLEQPNPPAVVVMTGLSDPRLYRDLMNRGVAEVYGKPCDYDSMATRLSWLLKSKHGEKDSEEDQEPSHFDQLKQVETSLFEFTPLFADRLQPVFDFDEQLESPPAAVKEFIKRFARRDEEAAARYRNEHEELRQAPRIAYARNAIAVPVDRSFRPCGDPFMTAIRDVSESGIRLLHTRALSAAYLALSWRAETLPYSFIKLVISIERCAARGPFYDIGGKFVMAD